MSIRTGLRLIISIWRLEVGDLFRLVWKGDASMILVLVTPRPHSTYKYCDVTSIIPEGTRTSLQSGRLV